MEVASLKEGKWFCYRGGLFNGGGLVMLDGWMDERCFRPLLCTVKARIGPGTTWANEMNLG